MIPKSAYPFFLPKSEENAFIFILNPQEGLRQRKTVLVQDLENVCTRANGGGYVSRTICSSQRIEWKGQEWLRKGDETIWTYSPVTAVGANARFVSCHKMQIEGHPGLCTATLALDDLVLTISLDDDELSDLEATYDQAVSMLHSWEA